MTGKAESMGFMKATPKMLLLGLVVGFITVGCTTTTAWEYKTRTTSQRLGPFALSGYGQAGWQLAGYSCTPRGTNFEYEYIFERPKHSH